MLFSIGLHRKTASLRGILNSTANFGLYLTAEVGHTWGSNVTVDRDSYLFHDELLESDEMPVANVLDYSALIFYIKSRVQTEVWFDAFTGLIVRWDYKRAKKWVNTLKPAAETTVLNKKERRW